jgi:pimeloyl-ACP methyl ester carboxylesterase
VAPDWWLPSDDGRTLLPDDPGHVFYADCPPDVAAAAASRITPQRRDVFEQELRGAAWQSLPSTYVVCTRDNAIPPALQERMSERAGSVSHLDSGHSPFLARPDDLAAIIRETLAATVAGA